MDRGWQFRLLIMSNYKLYSVINSGYRLNVRAALISNRYPLNSKDITYISPLSVVSGELKDVPVYKDELNISALSVISGLLEVFEFPIMIDTVSISPLSIVSGTLNTAVVHPSNQIEQSISISNLNVVSGTLRVVVVDVPNQIEQSIAVSNLSVISGTLI